jgi:general secretion pathway protein G
MKNTRGFTLIELLVAVAIIGILSSFLISSFVGARQRARDAERKSDVRQIQTAIEFYKTDYGTYPPTIPNCNAADRSIKFPNPPQQVYMKEVPCDPLNSLEKYLYSCSTPQCNTYTLSACLENAEDSEGDVNPATGDPIMCADGKRVRFTVKNPS